MWELLLDSYQPALTASGSGISPRWFCWRSLLAVSVYFCSWKVSAIEKLTVGLEFTRPTSYAIGTVSLVTYVICEGRNCCAVHMYQLSVLGIWDDLVRWVGKCILALSCHSVDFCKVMTGSIDEGSNETLLSAMLFHGREWFIEHYLGKCERRSRKILLTNCVEQNTN